MNKVEGIILDWAGTAVDFGCFAPVNVFVDIFKNAGLDVTMEEARAPMGMLKIDHIRAMLTMPRISSLWEEQYGRPFNEEDVEKLYAEFEPALMMSLADYTDPIPGYRDSGSVKKSWPEDWVDNGLYGYNDGGRRSKCFEKGVSAGFPCHPGCNPFDWKALSLHDISEYGRIEVNRIMEGSEGRRYHFRYARRSQCWGMVGRNHCRKLRDGIEFE